MIQYICGFQVSGWGRSGYKKDEKKNENIEMEKWTK